MHVGNCDGESGGGSVGADVPAVGVLVGCCDGESGGGSVGDNVDGELVGNSDGESGGGSVGDSVVGVLVGYALEIVGVSKAGGGTLGENDPIVGELVGYTETGGCCNTVGKLVGYGSICANVVPDTTKRTKACIIRENISPNALASITDNKCIPGK